MRFKRFLTENYEFSFDKVVDLISRECQPFLRESKNLPLFRGVTVTKPLGGKDDTPEQFSAKWFAHPKDRKPKDSWTRPGFNFMFNAMADVAFNETNIREKTLFATGKSSVASTYGPVHFCFPCGPIQYIWSESIKDSFEDESNILDILSDVMNDRYQTGREKFSFLMLRRMLEKLALSTENKPHVWIHNLNRMSKEILDDVFIHLVNEGTFTQEFYIKYIENAEFDKFEALVEDLEQVADMLYIDSKNLDAAIKSSHEILIYKSSGYYMIPANMVYEEMIKAKERITNRYEYDEMYQFMLAKM